MSKLRPANDDEIARSLLSVYEFMSNLEFKYISSNYNHFVKVHQSLITKCNSRSIWIERSDVFEILRNRINESGYHESWEDCRKYVENIESQLKDENIDIAKYRWKDCCSESCPGMEPFICPECKVYWEQWQCGGRYDYKITYKMKPYCNCNVIEKIGVLPYVPPSYGICLNCYSATNPDQMKNGLVNHYNKSLKRLNESKETVKKINFLVPKLSFKPSMKKSKEE